MTYHIILQDNDNICIHSCIIVYKYICVQSIVEDAAFMLKQVNLSQEVEYPYYRKATDTSLIKQYFSGLTKDGLERLYQTYKLDFDLFQYSIPQYVWDVV